MAEMYVVRSKVKELVGKKGFNMSSDFADALSRFVESQVTVALNRCKENGRKTVRAHDI